MCSFSSVLKRKSLLEIASIHGQHTTIKGKTHPSKLVWALKQLLTRHFSVLQPSNLCRSFSETHTNQDIPSTPNRSRSQTSVWIIERGSNLREKAPTVVKAIEVDEDDRTIRPAWSWYQYHAHEGTRSVLTLYHRTVEYLSHMTIP